jgi:MFS family permease
MGKAMGLYGTNMPIATVAAFPAATLLMLTYGTWRVPLYVGTVFAASAIAVFTVFVKEGPLRQTERKKISMRRTLANTELWKAGLVWLFFQVTTISFLTWAETLFQTHKGLDPLSASILAITFMLTTIPLVPLFGWLSDRSGQRKPFLVAGPVIMALAMIATAYTNGLFLVASVVLLGVGAATVPAVVSALPPEILKPDEVGVGFGVMAVCLNLGAAVAAPLLGYFYDVTGSLTLSFAVIAVFSLLGTAAAYTLKSN